MSTQPKGGENHRVVTARPLRCLIVEDAEDDVVPLLRQLRAGGYDVTWERVDTPEAMRAALGRQPWDVVISDYSMPRFSGLAALELLQASGLDLPFIVVSGTIGEDVAVAAMKAGAHDYLMKGKLARLAPAVQRELREAARRRERKQAEAALRTSEEHLSNLFEKAPLGYQSLDADGRFIVVNEAWLTTLGYGKEEVMGKWFGDFLAPEYVEAFRQRFQMFKAAGKIHSEFEMIRKNGARRFVAFAGSIAHNPDGSFRQTHCIFQDITERKQAEDKLRESEAKYRNLFENMAEEVHFWKLVRDERGQIKTWQVVDVNAPTLKAWGRKSREDTIGKMADEIYPGATEHFMPMVQKIMTEGVPYSFVDHFPQPGDKYFRFTSVPMGEYFITTGSDITDITKIQLALHKSEELYRSLFANMLNGFAYCRMLFEDGNPDDFIYLAVNDAFEKQTGLKNVVGKKVSEVIPGIRESDPELFACYGRVASTGQPEHFETFVNVLQMWFWVSVYRPAPGHFVAVFDVITERKRAENEMRASEDRLNFALQTIQTGAWELDLLKHSAYRTPTHDRIFGYETLLPQWTYEMFLEHVLSEDRPEVDRKFREATTAQTDWNFECRIRRADGATRWIMAAGRHQRNTEGVLVRMAGIVQDITERKRMEEALRHLNAELEKRVAERTGELQAANKELEAFSYSVSHDLRAPLRSIDGFSSILLEDYADKLDAEGCDNLGRVRAAAQRMSELIDDLLNLSRCTRAELHREQVDLSALARAVVADLRQREPGRAVELAVADGIVAGGDPRLLRVVLDNLLGNAWKFTGRREHARIEFGAVRRIGRMDCFVRDNGAGFDAAYAARLFGAFQRLHSSAEFPGSGIGLATVQRIVHRHGGRVWAEGEVDKGATFWFNIEAST